MTLVEKMLKKFEEAGYEMPGPREGYTIRRTYAGYHQKSAGALSWTLWHKDLTYAGHASNFGSAYPASECAKMDSEIYHSYVTHTVEIIKTN